MTTPRPPPSRTDFNRLYEAEFDYVWNTLRRLGVPEAHVEDVAHDVFITAWKKFSDYDPTRPLRPWLFGIAYRLASDFRDKAWQKREVADAEPDAADEAPTPEAHAQTSQARVLVLKAMESMPLERRAVFVMHELEGQGIPEVAQALAVPLNTAYSRLRLARRDFAEAVEKLKGGVA
jgi:RNA polymerase sigma-70 factor, ECF subfamily